MNCKRDLRRATLIPVLSFAMLASRACSAEPDFDGPPLRGALADLEPEWAAVLAAPRYAVALRFTRIDRDAEGRPEFHSSSYGKADYFYPASTVKFPAVLLALEALEEKTFREKGVTADTPLRPASGVDTSLRRVIRDILLVSDNDAFNVLFDLVGPDALSSGMAARGYEGVRIFHRLAAMASGRDRPAGPLTFLATGEKPLLVVPVPNETTAYNSPEPILRGIAHRFQEQRIDLPMDFTRHNAFPLAAQQESLKAFLFPESAPETSRFRISPDNRRLVLRAMGEFASESREPTFDPKEFPAAYARFFVSADDGNPLPGLRSFGKSGQAYGTTTDNAYVVDQAHGVEFLIAATITTNANGTLNDNTYEYRTVAEPFLHAICRAILDHERTRAHAHKPDFREVREFLPRE